MANKTELFIQKNNTNWTEVDLSDNIPFPITFNIADVREINNRNGSYSKTIEIPGTKVNNDVFKYIFDIQSIDNYDTRVRVKANVVVDTIPVLEGYIQLDAVNCDDNKYWTYNCIIYGENANFSKNIDQNALLNALDFSEFDHSKTLDAITQSWVGDYTYGYYYPLLDYNNGKDPIVPQSQSGSRGIVLRNENFKPSIYVKQYWDKIFKLYGYTYESDFLNSTAFTDLIIPTNVKVLQNQDLWRFNSSFKAGITELTSVNVIPATTPTLVSQLSNDNITYGFTMSTSSPFFYDAQGVFNDIPGGSFRYENTYQGTIQKNQKIVFNIDYKVTLSGGTPSNPYEGVGFLIFYKFYKNGIFSGSVNIGKVQTFGSVDPTNPLNGNDINYVLDNFGPIDGDNISQFDRRQLQVVYDTSVNGLIDDGDTIEVRLGLAKFATDSSFTGIYNYVNTVYNLEFYPSTNGYDGTYYYNKIDTSLLADQPFTLSQSIPGNIKQIDFINSIIKMFNLYLSQDKVDPKKIYIEPRDEFYETTFVDWSRKLDISKDILQKPIVDRKKRVLMSYKEDKDLFNANYKANTNQIYGQYEYLTDNEFDTSDQKIEVIFSPSPLTNRKKGDGNLDNRIVYTQILDPKQVINAENYNNIDSNIRILYKKNIQLTGSVLTILGSPFFYTYETYPYAGHLDDPTSPGLDLSFSEPLYLFYEYQNFGYTNNNLYKLYYEQFFEEVYGLESKHITAYIYLTPQDIIDFDYRRLVYLDSASSGTSGYFRVNKIEYDPFNKQSYKVELIKVLNNFKSKYNKIIAIGGGITDVGVTLPNWGTGLVTNGNYNSGDGNIISGVDNSVRGNLNIVGGVCNQVLVGGSNIVTGIKNNIISDNSGIISGGESTIYGTGRYSNIIGGLSQSLSGPYSSIIGGCNNEIFINSSNNQILGGCDNKISYNSTGTSSISQTTNSLILGGINNKIEIGTTTSITDNVFILGGLNNTISAGITNSFIIGGENVTATQSNTVYLEGNVLINGLPVEPSIWFSEVSGGRNWINAIDWTTNVTVLGELSDATHPTIGNIHSSNMRIYDGKLGIDFTNLTGTYNTAIELIPGANSDVMSIIHNALFFGETYSTALSFFNGNLGDGLFISHTRGDVYPNIGSQLSEVNLTSSGVGVSYNDSTNTSSLNINSDGLSLSSNISGLEPVSGGGPVTISSPYIKTTSKVFVTGMNGASDVWYVDNIVAGVSFDVTALSTGGTGDIAWLIIN